MKTAAAILAAAMLFQEPDKFELSWNPPPDRIVVVSLTSSMSMFGPVPAAEVKAEAELHPLPGAAKGERAFVLKGIRYHHKNRDARFEGELLYERGKEPVVTGRTSLNDQAIEKMKDDIPISITDRGLRHADPNIHQVFEKVSTGTLPLQLPPAPVKEGASWVSTPGVPFKGKLQFIVKSITRGKVARIEVKFLPADFSDDENPPTGSGELLYSFEDRLISSSSFTLTRKNRQGKVETLQRQTLTQKLKS